MLITNNLFVFYFDKYCRIERKDILLHDISLGERIASTFSDYYLNNTLCLRRKRS
ncbi:hypothetical protein ACJX0J_010026, partial [Zea mays]